MAITIFIIKWYPIHRRPGNKPKWLKRISPKVANEIIIAYLFIKLLNSGFI